MDIKNKERKIMKNLIYFTLGNNVQYINLANNNMIIKYIHYGESDWDGFIMYKKIG